MGVANFTDLIADETVGITEEEILPWLQEKGHPAMTMEALIG
jgi:acetyl-CoA synthase